MMRKERQLLFGLHILLSAELQAFYSEMSSTSRMGLNLSTFQNSLYRFASWDYKQKAKLVSTPNLSPHPSEVLASLRLMTGASCTAGGKSSLSFPTASLMQSPHMNGIITQVFTVYVLSS